MSKNLKENIVSRHPYFGFVVIILITWVIWVNFDSYSEFSDSILEDKRSLYPDSIEYAYLVDNLQGSGWDYTRYGVVIPFSMTNNYPEKEAYSMSVSLRYTYLYHTSFAVGHKYRTSHGDDVQIGKPKPGDTSYALALRFKLLYLALIQKSVLIPEDFTERTKVMCNVYNPSFVDPCNGHDKPESLEKLPIEVALNPGETSQPFYFHFPIPYEDEPHFDSPEQTFELRLVRVQDYYSIPVQKWVDCRGEKMLHNEQCRILPVYKNNGILNNS